MLSGLVHFGIWLVLGGEWEGPVSWRKPALFGISTGMTVLSIGWLVPKLQPKKLDLFLCAALAISLVVEVALITLQQWRGVASHFNHEGHLNNVIENWMTYLIVAATLSLAEFTRRSFGSLNAPNDLKLAIKGGMAFLMVSCLIGFATLFHENAQVTAGNDPSIYGKAGVTKFPHGVAIHTLQLFPLACWLMTKLGLPIEQRTRLIVYLIASTSMLLLFSIIQTLSGQSRFDLTFGGGLCLAASAICLAPLFFTLGRQLKLVSKPKPSLSSYFRTFRATP